MAEPRDVVRILNDAARLVREGEIVVIGSAALAVSLEAPVLTRDVDLWCEPAERGDVLTALMGEFSWYHERHGAWVEVWAPETFCAPTEWRSRVRIDRHPEFTELRLVIPHPHDVIFSKLERFEGKDRDHARAVFRERSLDDARRDTLEAEMPHRRGTITDPDRIRRFEAGLVALRAIAASSG